MMYVKTMEAFAQMLVDRTRSNFDNIIIVESGSEKGTGKSTFSMQLDMWILKIIRQEFVIEDVVIFDATNEKVVDLVKTKPDAWPIHIDEASKVAYKRNYNDKDQKDLIIFVNVCRKHHKIIILNNPTFYGLDKDLLELADFRVTILQRGTAIVRGKTSNPETQDKWMRKETDDLIKKTVHNMMDKEAMMRVLRKTPNYLFDIRYGDLPADIYQQYEAMSKEQELESFQENSGNGIKHERDALVGIIEIMKRRHGHEFSWRNVVVCVNRYLKMRGAKNFARDDVYSKITHTLAMVEFDELFEFTKGQPSAKREKKKGESKDSVDGVIVNNNNNISEVVDSEAPPLVSVAVVDEEAGA